MDGSVAEVITCAAEWGMDASVYQGKYAYPWMDKEGHCLLTAWLAWNHGTGAYVMQTEKWTQVL